MEEIAVTRLNLFGSKKLRLVRQTETMECGHACLAMILQYYGHDIDMISLRTKFPANTKGTTLNRIVQMAHQLELSSRSLKLDLEDLPNLRSPCILHWEMSHFVVLESYQHKKAIIFDPAKGKLEISIEDLDKCFTGIAVELTPTSKFKKKKEKIQLKLHDLIPAFTEFWSSLLQIFVLSLALQTFALVGPYHSQIMIDKVLPSLDYDLLTVIGLGFVTLTFFHYLTSGLRSWVILYLGSLLNFHLAFRLFSHLIHLPLDYFERRHVGDIQSRFGSLSAIEALFTTGFVTAAVDGIMIITTLTLMLYYSLELSLIAIGATTLYISIQLILYRPIKNATEAQIIQGARLDSHFLETLRSMQALKSFGKERERHNDWSNKYVDSMNAGIHLNKINIISGTVQSFLIGIEGIITVWVAGTVMLSASMSVGMFFAFIAFRTRFSAQAQSLISCLIQFLMVRLHLERIADVALHEKENNVYSRGVSTEDLDNSISLQNINFRYAEHEPFLLSNVNLKIKSNECVAITGESGSGKTTLMKVMMGLLPPSDGYVYIGGKSLEQIGLRDYRNMCSAVMQNDQLIAGTILQNICFFDLDYNLEKIIQVAKASQIYEEIEAMPLGMHTQIGDMGSALSGGQQQRILLARALYNSPRILFLDESTSNLDVKNELIINQSIRDLKITRVIIAHRQETLNLADRTLYLNAGMLTEYVKSKN